MLPDIQAAASEAGDGEEYVERDDEMDALFVALLAAMKKKKDEWKYLRKLMAKRSEVLVLNVLKGLNLTVKKASDILKDGDSEQKKILIAAIDNLVDFGVAEEYQMGLELRGYDLLDDEDNEGEGEDDSEENPEELDEEEKRLLAIEEGITTYNTSVYEKYNKRWAVTENRDVIWAAIVAEKFARYDDRTILVYMTQGDERVRPWHRALEGLAYPKESFPEWLIPPIEWACRCFLVDETVARGDIEAVEDVMIRFNGDKKMPEWMNPVFKESLAKRGRIFSESHRYFEIDKKHRRRLRNIATRLKKHFINEYFG